MRIRIRTYPREASWFRIMRIRILGVEGGGGGKEVLTVNITVVCYKAAAGSIYIR